MAEQSELLRNTVDAANKLINRRKDLQKIEQRAEQRRRIREAQASDNDQGSTEPSGET